MPYVQTDPEVCDHKEDQRLQNLDRYLRVLGNEEGCGGVLLICDLTHENRSHLYQVGDITHQTNHENQHCC